MPSVLFFSSFRGMCRSSKGTMFNFSHHHVTCLAELGPTSKTGGLWFLFKNYFEHYEWRISNEQKIRRI